MIKKLRIGFFGDNIWAHNILKMLIRDKTIIVTFVCGRYSPLDTQLFNIAKNNNMKFYRVKKVNNKKFINILKKSKSDVFVSMSYNQIFKKEIIKIVNKKIINCHAGKLPFYRGRNVLNWAIINGEKEFGITTHFINEKIDQGDIIIQKVFKISKKDDFKSVFNRATKQCAILLYKTVKKIQKKKYIAIPQNKISKKISYFDKRRKGDEIIDLSKKSHEIENFVRGLVKPGPCARIKFKNNEIFVEKIKILKKKNKRHFNLGKIVNIKKKSFYLNTIDGKMICVEKWFSKKKIKLKLGFRLI